jgi:DNA-binding beta-propeller fold protein YncE
MDEIIYGKQPKQEAVIGHPYGVAMWQGKIYICDTQNDKIEVLDLRKHQMLLMGAPEAGKLAKPVAIAISSDGYKYVADVQVDSIAVFDPSDQFARQIAHPNFQPVGLAVFGNELYVTAYKNNRVEVFDRLTGASLRFIGEPGTGNGQMVGPLGVAVDGQGNVFVDDIINCRVQKFSPSGKFLASFGALGDFPGSFTRPKHIAVDSEGIVYVVDGAFENVQMFDKLARHWRGLPIPQPAL